MLNPDRLKGYAKEISEAQIRADAEKAAKSQKEAAKLAIAEAKRAAEWAKSDALKASARQLFLSRENALRSQALSSRVANFKPLADVAAKLAPTLVAMRNEYFPLGSKIFTADTYDCLYDLSGEIHWSLGSGPDYHRTIGFVEDMTAKSPDNSVLLLTHITSKGFWHKRYLLWGDYVSPTPTIAIEEVQGHYNYEKEQMAGLIDGVARLKKDFFDITPPMDQMLAVGDKSYYFSSSYRKQLPYNVHMSGWDQIPFNGSQKAVNRVEKRLAEILATHVR